MVVTSDVRRIWKTGMWSLWNQHWFQLENLLEKPHVTVKEMVPIVLAAALWGKDWQGMSVQTCCDNSAVVAIINLGNSVDPASVEVPGFCLSEV